MFKKIYLILVAMSMSLCAETAPSTHFYKDELKQFKAQPETALIFDKEANHELRALARQSENYKNLTYWQTWGVALYDPFNIVRVTENSMPHLYATIRQLCLKGGIDPMPTVYVSANKGILNAFAAKLFASAGIVVIFQKMINDLSDQELDGVIAHELGHIKYNHANKNLAIFFGTFIPLSYLAYKNYKNTGQTTYLQKLLLPDEGFYWITIPAFISSIITLYFGGKTFERQADEFAYKNLEQGQGLLGAFHMFKEHEDRYETDYQKTIHLIESNKPELNPSIYNDLQFKALITHANHSIKKWLQKNTFLSSHPTPEERIETVEKYLIEHATA